MERDVELLPRDQAMHLVWAWSSSLEGLAGLLRLLPAGSTLEDALRVHRALAQARRQPSRVMRDEDP